VHAPTEDKSDDIKDWFYEEQEHAFNSQRKYENDIKRCQCIVGTENMKLLMTMGL
jgi:hypothetical protein